MLLQIGLAAGLVITTTVVHAAFMLLTVWMFHHLHTQRWNLKLRSRRLALVFLTVLTMFVASIVEVTMWAGTYLATGALSDLETSLYFSMVTFTTLGYGDVLLGESWRLLASLQAANGIIMFGWTTAIILAVVQRVYFPASSDSPGEL